MTNAEQIAALPRERIAELVNIASHGSRRGGRPVLTGASDRETLIAWLQWNDPNGCHTDALAAVEGFEPYTLDRAWEAVADMVADAIDVAGVLR